MTRHTTAKPLPNRHDKTETGVLAAASLVCIHNCLSKHASLTSTYALLQTQPMGTLLQTQPMGTLLQTQPMGIQYPCILLLMR